MINNPSMNKTRYESEWFDRNALGIAIYKDEAFAYMAKAGKLAAHILDHVAQFVVAGVSTLELNDICHDEIIRHGAIPAPLNYRGFPKSICTSINNVICHGIPAENIKLKSGDIINIDVTVILDGWYGDTSRMFAVGKISPLATRLINATHDALMGAISIVKPNATFFDIGKKDS